VSVSAESPLTLSLRARISYPGFTLNIDHELALDRIVGLFGASGSGKSTLLRTIAGFEKGARGRIGFGADCWQDTERRHFVPAWRRPVGFVFQDTRLFEHRDVAGNLQFADSRSTPGSTPIAFDDVLAAFDLHSLLSRRVDALSGGERQRVALARSLLSRPRILLLDEPLAALDTGRKGDILPYLESLPERFGIPVVYVSHAIDEIARLCDRVIVLDRGQVSASGNVSDVLNSLALQSPRSMQGHFTVVDAQVVEQLADVHLTRLVCSGQSIVVPMLTHLSAGSAVRLSVRASDVAIATSEPQGLSFRNVLPGTIMAIDADRGSAFAIVSMNVGDTVLRSQLTNHAVRELRLKPGMQVFALLKTASFDRQL
jgi:molybdate transport system ATP-binding protein